MRKKTKKNTLTDKQTNKYLNKKTKIKIIKNIDK